MDKTRKGGLSYAERFLYRGVSESLHLKNKGRLIPKDSNQPFERQAYWGEGYWNEFTWESSEDNAVYRHQLRQEGYPTSGISTTPHLEIAKKYATNGGVSGYIYKIDRTLLEVNGVREHFVSDYLFPPCAPEDDEVILVAKDFGTLPDAIIVEIISV